MIANGELYQTVILGPCDSPMISCLKILNSSEVMAYYKQILLCFVLLQNTGYINTILADANGPVPSEDE